MLTVNWEISAQDWNEAWALQIAVEFSMTHVQTYLAEIQAAENRIAAHPKIGTDFKSPRKRLKRLVTSSGYSVFYQLDDLEKPTYATIVSIVRGQQEL